MTLFSDRGTPDGYHNMHGYSGHTFKFVNEEGKFHYVQIHVRKDGGVKTLTDEQAGHCVSIREDGEEDPKTGKQKFGLCVLDSSTSEFNLSAFEDDVCRTKLETLIRQLRPKEIVYRAAQ